MVPPWTIWVHLPGQRSLGSTAVGHGIEGNGPKGPNTGDVPPVSKVGAGMSGDAAGSTSIGGS